MKRKFKNIFRLALIFIAVTSLFSCEDLVSSGIRADYGETDALLEVTALKDTFGVQGDTIRFLIKAESNQNIRSFSISAQYQGDAGTEVTFPGEDPFIDHSFGTIQDETTSFEIIYNYVIPEDANKVRIEFILTDELGKKTIEQSINAVTDVATYTDIVLHSKTNYNTDGFTSNNGMTYQNLKLYESVTEFNREVQENLDLVFLVSGGNSAQIAAPAHSGFSSNMAIKNKTNLLLLSNMTAEEFEAIRPGIIQNIVPVDEIKEANSYVVSNVKVGDYIGFITDFNATNSYKIGVLKVKSLHRSSCYWYEGNTFMIEFDAKVEVSE